MTGNREQILLQAVDVLLNARRTGTTIPDLDEAVRPADVEEVAFVQDALASAFGEIGGWKIGAPAPGATPAFAPMPLAWIAADGATLAGPMFRYRGLEAEIAFLVGEDLPPRSKPYTREEVVAAMESCHPAIEELETVFADTAAAAKFSMLADLQTHGGFIYGPAIAEWQQIDFTAERVTLCVDGVVRVDRVGSNTSGDLVGLLPYLANEGAARTGGLHRGQWITTGSWTGNTLASSGSAVDVVFGRAGSVSMRFA